MADETIDPADASNDPQKAAAAQPAEPEPQILEETIIRKVVPAEKKSVAAPKFAPLPNVKGMAVPPKSMPPEEIPATPTPTPIAAAAPPPTPTAPAQIPSPVTVLPHPETPAPIVPPKIEIPRVEERKPAPVAAPIQQAASSKTLEGDISGILKGVQLPERRNPDEEKAATAKQFDTKLGAAAAEAVSVMPTSPEAAVAAPKDPDDIVAVHTLKDDLQHVVHDQKISVVRAVSLEEDRRARQKKEFGVPTPAKKTHRLAPYLFSVVLLLVLGAAAIFGVYTIASQRGGDQQSGISSTSSMLFAESSVVFPLDNHSPEDLKNTLVQARNSPQGTLGSITRIIPTVSTTSPDGSTQTRAATFSEFMAAIGAQVPDELERALSDQFFFGIHTVDTNAPLFVIPVTSYDHAFAGMLAWESTMNADLSPFFTAVPALTTGSNGIPTQRTFQDLVMRNYDVRALEDDSGNIVLYYSFPTQNLLVIAESPYSFTEILSRLQAQGEL